MFFSSAMENARENYRLLLDATQFADEHGFCCVWTPERHFHEFGGAFPNPSVTNAGLATITKKVQLRAGSLISPLHSAIRIAEEWAVVDNLSGGRVAISFGSGWNSNDFIFYPENYAARQKIMYEQIELVRHLWRGGSTTAENSFGKTFEFKVFPRPVQAELPVWVTSSGNVDTFVSAGSIGANLLTHLIGQDLATLTGKIQAYRDSLETAGFPRDHGKVSLMLHTFLGDDVARVRRTVYTPFREYLKSSVSLEIKAARGGGVISGGHKIDAHSIDEQDMDELLDRAFERYFRTSLLGTPTSREALIRQLTETGVDEIACLIDFIPDSDAIRKSLQYLAELRDLTSPAHKARAAHEAVNSFMDDLEEEL